MNMLYGLLLGSVLALTGCQSAYRAAEGHEPLGYRETRIDDRRYQVSFESWRGRHAQHLHDWALYRAAELAQQQGYAWLRVISTREDAQEQIVAGVDQYPIIRQQEATSHAALQTPGAPMQHTVLRATLEVEFMNSAEGPAQRVEGILARPLP